MCSWGCRVHHRPPSCRSAGPNAIRRESPGDSRWPSQPPWLLFSLAMEQGILLAMILSLLRIVHHSYRPHTAVLEETHSGFWRLNPVVPGAITSPAWSL